MQGPALIYEGPPFHAHRARVTTTPISDTLVAELIEIEDAQFYIMMDEYAITVISVTPQLVTNTASRVPGFTAFFFNKLNN